eukprot:4770145-Pleurochrysis_carterae.AAC.1
MRVQRCACCDARAAMRVLCACCAARLAWRVCVCLLSGSEVSVVKDVSAAASNALAGARQ